MKNEMTCEFYDCGLCRRSAANGCALVQPTAYCTAFIATEIDCPKRIQQYVEDARAMQTRRAV